MFEASLLEPAGQKRRGWATIASFTVQAVIVGLLVLVPLIYTQALPHLQILGGLISPPVSGAPPSEGAKTPPHQRSNTSEFNDGVLRQPVIIPSGVRPITDEPGGPPPLPSGPYIPGALPSDGRGGPSIALLLTPTAPLPPGPDVAKRVVLSTGVVSGFLISKVTPAYPQLAVVTRTQGAVVLQAVISKEGRIEGLRVLSGHPLLIKAAVDAVQQWRYRPYLLNGQPVEVETEIVVNFTLGGG